MTFSDDCSSLSAFLEGMRIPNPPCRAGRPKRSHSRSFGGGRPVIAGIRFVLSTSSRGTSRWLMSGTTRLRYVHLLSSLVPGADFFLDEVRELSRQTTKN